MKIVLQSTITCPDCGHKKEETMPTDACQYFYECDNCKKVLKPKKWSKDSPSYNLIINNIKFEDLNKEQYEFLYKLKPNE